MSAGAGDHRRRTDGAGTGADPDGREGDGRADSGSVPERDDPFAADVAAERRTRADLLAELGLLAEENRRLRAETERDRRRSFRRAALAAGLLGVVAAAGGVALPASSTVLFALAGVGLFTAVLAYFLTPERVIAAPVSERVYAALATTGDAIRADLDLREVSVYLPVDPAEAPPGAAPVRLFVPQRDDYEVPTAEEAARAFVVTDDERRRGASFVPTGATLVSAFEADDDAVGRLNLVDYVARVADALVDGFELVSAATADVDSAQGVVTVGVRRSALGPVDRFDHPVGSFVAAALARRLDVPVTLTSRPAEDGRLDYYLSCRWDPDAVDSEATGIAAAGQ